MAQNKKYVGTWEGTLNVGTPLRIVFHIKDKDGIFVSSADSPDQKAFGLTCDTTFVSANNITIEMKGLGATFNGTLINDTVIDGNFSQRGADFPLVLKKIKGPETEKKQLRPQTPRPPFPYKSEDVIYESADKLLKYGATITIPEGSGPFPAAVLITGSGQQDRDETLAGHKPFAVIADNLSRNGYIVLRVDDRGIGKTTGKFSKATSADFANDVNTSLNYLLSRTEVDKKKVGLIGHSEGGMIAPMVASERKDINFIILLAGPGIKIIDLMAEQNEAVAISSGISNSAGKNLNEIFKTIVTAIINAPDSKTGIQQAQQEAEKWAATQDTSLLKELDIATPDKRKTYVLNMALQIGTPWFKYFIQFDPAPYLKKLRCKVLALNGEKDIQVLPESNLAGITSSLKKSKARKVVIKKMPGLNHLFQACSKCTVEEYAELEETFSPVALQEMVNWLNKNVK